MQSPFSQTSSALLASRNFTVYLYKVTPENMRHADLDPDLDEYAIYFKTERGICSIYSKDAGNMYSAITYLSQLYGHGPDDEFDDAVIWEY